MKDRRSGRERRAAARVSISVETQWESAAAASERQAGIISDISTTGCFVLCSGEVEDGEKVKVFLPLGDAKKIEFAGEVANHFLEIGFGIRFTEMSAARKDFLEKFIDALSSK